MNDHDLRALWVLSRVAAHGSFAGAARELGQTRAGVSRLIAQTEARLGLRLAQRSTRQVVLTEQAQQLVDAVQPALATLSAALAALPEAGAELRGPLRIACSHVLGQTLLLPLLQDFVSEHPGVKLELLWSDRVEDLIGQRIDIAVRLGELPDSSLVARPVGRVELALVGAPSLLKGRRAPRSIADLAHWPAIVLRPPGVTEPRPWRFVSALGQETYNPSAPRAEVSAIETGVALCRAGLGLTMLPRYAIAEDLRARRLKLLMPDQIGPGPAVHVCTTQRELLPLRVKKLIEVLVPGLRKALTEA